MDYNESKLKIFINYIKPHKGLFAVDMVLSVLVMTMGTMQHWRKRK